MPDTIRHSRKAGNSRKFIATNLNPFGLTAMPDGIRHYPFNTRINPSICSIEVAGKLAIRIWESFCLP